MKINKHLIEVIDSNSIIRSGYSRIHHVLCLGKSGVKDALYNPNNPGLK
jgi:hypothetical protein